MMMQRCTNPNYTRYGEYGGSGIKICDRWLVFENFLADMGKRPPGHSLDRKDNNGNYEPGNCRWATPTEQNRNRGTWAKSGVRGVEQLPSGNYRVTIWASKGKRIQVGVFPTIEDAANARREAEKTYWESV